MRVLAVDAATEVCSVALLCGEMLIGRSVGPGKSHAQQVLDMVDAVLAEAHLSLSALDGIAASIGPGAFTGVRISVSVAQGLAFGAGLRVVPVTTLEALAARVVGSGAEFALACLDARMGEVYWGRFKADAARGVAADGGMADGGMADGAPAVGGIADGAPRVGPPDSVVLPVGGRVYRGIGRGFAAYPALALLPGLVLNADDGQALPDAREFARLGRLRLERGEGLDPADLSPLYLRDKVALTEAERAAR